MSKFDPTARASELYPDDTQGGRILSAKESRERALQLLSDTLKEIDARFVAQGYDINAWARSLLRSYLPTTAPTKEQRYEAALREITEKCGGPFVLSCEIARRALEGE